MKKALIITRVSGFLPQFEMNNVRILQSMGYEVHYAANFETIVYGKDNLRLSGTGIICHPVKMVRNPLSPKNLKAFLELKRLMQREKFDLVHCHMPVGGVLGRLAAYVTGTAPVIYTAHGFHFYKGAPVKNWIPYYLVERILAHMTDRLITINKEDYFRANTFFGRNHKKHHVYYVPGIGVELLEGEKSNKSEQSCRNEESDGNEESCRNKKCIGRDERQGEKRISVNRKCMAGNPAVSSILEKVNPSHFLLASVGELSGRKNHLLLVEAMAYLKGMPVSCLICGSGAREGELRKRIRELGLENQVILAGYVENVPELLKHVDCFVFPSRQEGLPVAVMEAMAAGLPVIATDIRGNRDLIRSGKGGQLICLNAPNQHAPQAFASAIRDFSCNQEKCKKMGQYNKKRIRHFSKEVVEEKMRRIYTEAEALEKPETVKHRQGGV